MFLTTLFLGAESVKDSANKISRVMTWVPPYATSKCLDRLNESFDGVGMINGLTHLGLQFWRPCEKGKIKLVNDYKPIDDSTIINFRKWGKAHNVHVLLCVYNGYKDGWNWDLAKIAFDKYRKILFQL